MTAKKDWDATFKDYMTPDFEDIRDYVLEEKPEYEETLWKMIEDGKYFPEIKRAFYEEFFPKYIPEAKPKKQTMKQWVEERKALKDKKDKK